MESFRKGYREINPELLSVIRKLRRKPRTQGKRRMTFESVAESLNDMGYRAANGREFSGNTVRGILHRQKKVTRLAA